MKKRWYDRNPMMSMAISLMHNALPHHRKKTIDRVRELLLAKHPDLTDVLDTETHQADGFWPFLQKRQTMNQGAWGTVEAMRYLNDAEQEEMAVEIISFIYCLENADPGAEQAWNSLSTFELVV